MPPISRERRLLDFLRTRPTRPTRSVAIEHLEAWMTHEQATTTIERAIERSGTVRVVQGGRLVYWDTEQGRGTSLYETVARVIRNQWGRKHLGLRDVETARPPHGKTKSEGVWTRPDLVIAAFPRKRRSADDPKHVHALEVERESGFDVRSVYQAYEQARGAHFAWVFAHASTVDGRIEAAADDLGVGVVAFTNPNSVAAYRTVLKPEPRDDAEPAKFMHRCFPNGTDALTGWKPTG